VLATVFYDDFPVLEYSDMSNARTLLLNTLLDLLGWQHAVVGKKACPFGSTMAVLGVGFELSTIFRGTFKVRNKPGKSSALWGSCVSVRNRVSSVNMIWLCFKVL